MYFITYKETFELFLNFLCLRLSEHMQMGETGSTGSKGIHVTLSTDRSLEVMNSTVTLLRKRILCGG